MPGTATWPITINSNTYTLADFDGFSYVQNFPAIISDINVVALQAAADRAAILAALSSNGNLLIPQTQGRLDYISTTQVRLSQAGGSFLWIDGLNRPIPAGGVNLANTGLTAATFYYVYAYMNGATMVLEASTTVHVGHASGLRVKSGDATRTLVGMIYMDTGGVFANANAKRFVRSYFNRQAVPILSTITTATTSSTTFVDLSANYLVEGVLWLDDVLDLQYTGYTANSGGLTYSTLAVDGANFGGQVNAGVSGGTPITFPLHPRGIATRTEGYHTMTLRGMVSAGTGTWVGYVTGVIG